MGRENKGMKQPANRSFETFKLNMRFLYGIFIWYEFWFWPEEIDMPLEVLGNKQFTNKAPFWAASIILYIIEITEATCGQGRFLSMLTMIFVLGTYVALYSQQWQGKWVKILLNVLMDLSIFNNQRLVYLYGIEDFSNYKLHGSYQVGFKRFKAREGNDCLIFYPVDMGTKQISCTPYKDVAKMIKGCKIIGMAPGQQSTITHRVVSQLSPNAPLAEDFSSGKNKLIPMVHIHGLMACAAEHTAVPMQLASNGYICIVPDMMDNTAPWTTDKNGDDIWFENKVMETKDVEKICADQRMRFDTKRVPQCHAIAAEIKEKDFLEKLGLGAGHPMLDHSRLFIGGQSMGGWTSIAASAGDQDNFKICLAHDPAFYQNKVDIESDKIDMRVPTHMLCSEGFLKQMMPMLFQCSSADCFETYAKMGHNLAKRVGLDKFESLQIRNSGHMEQFDRVITEEFMMKQASQTIQGVPGDKSEGSNVQFHEFLGLLWLEYLYKMGHHDNTFNPYNFNERIVQFQGMIRYEQKLDQTMA